MIQILFYRDNKTSTAVTIELATDLPIDRSRLLPKFETGTQYAAELLQTYLTKALDKTIEIAHRNGYNQGWKDAKSKRPKCDTFSVTFAEDGERVGW